MKGFVMVRNCIVALASMSLFLGCGGNTADKLVQIEAKLVAVDSLLERHETMIAISIQQSKSVMYQLSDLDRDSKTVGVVYSKYSFAKGDRLFLEDDIWDVVGVKVFTADAFSPVLKEYSNQTIPQPKSFNVDFVELLVKFGGKATDPKPQP